MHNSSLHSFKGHNVWVFHPFVLSAATKFRLDTIDILAARSERPAAGLVSWLRKKEATHYGPLLNFLAWQALAGRDQKYSMSELLVITQLFTFLRPRVSVKASPISSLLDIAESSNRRVLTIIFYDAVERGSVSLLGLFCMILSLCLHKGEMWACFRGSGTPTSSPSCIRTAWSASCGLKAIGRTIWANSCSREKHVMLDVQPKACWDTRCIA